MTTMNAAREAAKAHTVHGLHGTVHCLKCGYTFLGPIPPEQRVQLCNRCFSDVMRYVVAEGTTRQVHARLKAVHRLYGYTHPTTDTRLDACEEEQS